MPGGRGRRFGRRRGMQGGMSRNNKIVGELFDWIITAIQSKNKTDRTVIYRPSIESPDKTNKLNQLKELSKSLQSQLKEVNTRIYKNEETLVSPFPQIDETVCTGCGKCALSCLSEAIILENRIPHVDHNKCTGCGICVSECPVRAIEMIR
jgi:ferredoxin